jgi:hypothetical protein
MALSRAASQYRDRVTRHPERSDHRSGEPFGAVYARLWQRLRQLEWSAYVEDEFRNRSVVDGQLFEAASKTTATAEPESDADLAERVRRRILVDHHPEIARLRARLDEWSSYGPIPKRRSVAWRRRLAAAMEPDLMALISLRNQLARELGIHSYGHLAMTAEGLELERVDAALRKLRADDIEVARELASAEGATIETWLEALDRHAGPPRIDARSAAGALAERLGCADLAARLRWAVRDGPLAGWAAGLRIPDEIGILVRPARSVRDIVTVFHELGHALALAATRVTGLRAIPSDTQDETMGAVVEELGVRLMLAPEVRPTVDRIRAAESVRTATSALFEIAVQEDPRHARDLFMEWYAPFVDVGDPVIWASDSFLSVDPFRIHAYALGARYASALAEWLNESVGAEPAAWGRWLRDVLWAPGRRDRFADLLGLLGEHVPPELAPLHRTRAER